MPACQDQGLGAAHGVSQEGLSRKDQRTAVGTFGGTRRTAFLYYTLLMKSVPALWMVALVSAFAGTSLSASVAADPICTCRNRDGSRLELGQTTCIRVGDTAYLARCEKELNVMTWRKLRDECPEARLSVAVLPLTR